MQRKASKRGGLTPPERLWDGSPACLPACLPVWRKAQAERPSEVHESPCGSTAHDGHDGSTEVLTEHEHDGGNQGQAWPAATHVELPDTVEMASRGTAGWVSVRPGDAVSHIKSWRRAIVEGVAFGAGGHGLVTVRFGNGQVLTAESTLFMAEPAPDDGEGSNDHCGREAVGTRPRRKRVPKCLHPTCGYQANTKISSTCKFYGYCCGSCKLRHTGERACAKEHGPACEHVKFDEGALAENDGASAENDDNPWEGL